MGKRHGKSHHTITDQEAQEAINLEYRIAQLENRLSNLETNPDIEFLRRMKDRLDDLERHLKPSRNSSK